MKTTQTMKTMKTNAPQSYRNRNRTDKVQSFLLLDRGIKIVFVLLFRRARTRHDLRVVWFVVGCLGLCCVSRIESNRIE